MQKQAEVAKADTIRTAPTTTIAATVKIETQEPVTETASLTPKSRSITKKQLKIESDIDEFTIERPLAPPEDKKITKRVKAEAVHEEHQEIVPKGAPKKKRKATTKVEGAEAGDVFDGPKEGLVPKKKRKTGKKKEEEPVMPLAKRSVVGILKKSMYIGSHASAAQGIYLSTYRSSFFTRSQLSLL